MTGTEGNGLDAGTTFGSRIVTFAPGQQVSSAVLNGMQDREMTGANEGAESREFIAPSRTATGNQADSPEATLNGGVTVWLEAVTSGTAEVVIDDSIDWRDRWVRASLAVITGVGTYTPANDRPGGSGDNVITIDLTGSYGKLILAYTEQGQTGTGGTPGLGAITAYNGVGASTDTVRVYARSSDGALAMKKSGTTDPEFLVVGCVTASPMQNHY